MAKVIPDETVREILQRIDIVQLVGESVQLRKAGARFVGLCPFHAEKTPSFSVNPDQGFYYCFGCHAGGDAIHFLRETQGLDFREAVEQLAGRVGIALPEEELDARSIAARARARDERSKVLEANAFAQSFFRSMLTRAEGEEARAYMEARGVTEETAERFGLGAAPRSWDALTRYLQRNGVDNQTVERSGLVAPRASGGSYDRFRGRLTFPVLDLGGKVLGFSARILGKDEDAPKYVNSPDSPVFTKGETLYGLYPARRALRAERRAVIVEGNVDVLSLSQAGIENVVAPMGTALTESHVLLLKRFVDEMDLVFDGDRAGREAAEKALVLLLENGLGGRLVLLPEGEDPDSLVRTGGREAVAALIRKAPTLSDYFLDRALARYDGSVPSKTRVIESVAPLFRWLTSPVERDDYERKVEQHIDLPPGSLKRYVDTPESGVLSELPRETGRRRPTRAESRTELDLLQLLLAYPHFVDRFVEEGGPTLIVGEKRRWLAERLMSRIDAGTGRLEGWALLEDIEETRMRDFVARAMNDEPTVREDESERAFEDCLGALKERRRRVESRRVKLPSSGELSEEVKELLRRRQQLRDGDSEHGDGASE